MNIQPNLKPPYKPRLAIRLLIWFGIYIAAVVPLYFLPGIISDKIVFAAAFPEFLNAPLLLLPGPPPRNGLLIRFVMVLPFVLYAFHLFVTLHVGNSAS